MAASGHSNSSSHVAVEHNGDVLIGTILRASIGAQEAPVLLDSLVPLIAQKSKPMRHFAIDLSAVNFINSSGLGALLVLRKHADSRGARCYLIGSQPVLTEMMDMMRLPKLFTMVDDREQLEQHIRDKSS